MPSPYSHARTHAIVAAVALAAVSLVGCGFGSDDDDATTAAGSTAAASTDATSNAAETRVEPTTSPASPATETSATSAESPGGPALTDPAPATTETTATTAAATTVEQPASADDVRAVSDVVGDFLQAFRTGDGARGCALMTDDAKRDLLARAAARGLQTDSCPTALEAASDAAGAGVRFGLRFATTRDVRVQGDHADATVDVVGTRYPVTLERRSGQWLIATLPPVQG